MTTIISLDGNIGSGKSTLYAQLKTIFKDNPRVFFLPEPVDTWNTITDENGVTILENYYNDQKKFAFSFQMMAYISRLSLLRKALKNNDYNIIFTERSIYTDKNVFAMMLKDDEKISTIDYTIYLKWFDEFIEDIPEIHYIYIKTDPEVAKYRVDLRKRPGENIPLEYLQVCHEYHERWLNNEDNCFVINGNVDIQKNPEIQKKWVQRILDFVKSTLIKKN
jgi:deoxyadenosine/deoxycytidine kinase